MPRGLRDHCPAPITRSGVTMRAKGTRWPVMGIAQGAAAMACATPGTGEDEAYVGHRDDRALHGHAVQGEHGKNTPMAHPIISPHRRQASRAPSRRHQE